MKIADLAQQIAENDYILLEQLKSLRREKNISLEEVSSRLGISIEDLRGFEAYWSNPTLGEIRRYAIAIGARVSHSIESVDIEESELDSEEYFGVATDSHSDEWEQG